MNSTVRKRSLILGGHKTSVSLEDPFWAALKEIARDQRMSASQLAARIDGSREHQNLSSAIRLFVLNHYRSQVMARAELMRSAA
jgi:predicted DNA-binding ribbon-helix-helix protein